MEGMIWNANHVLDLALLPACKKSTDVMKGAKGVIIVNTVDVGFVLVGTRGSGVAMAKNDDGKWSAPCAVTISTVKLGMIAAANDNGLLFVFTEDDGINKFLSGASAQVGAALNTNFDTVKDREDLGAVNQYMTNKGVGSVYVYSYKLPNSFQGMTLESVTIKHHNKANERFYGKPVRPLQVVREGDVVVPDGSGVPDLQKKLAALEANQAVTPTPEMEEKKTSLLKEASIKESSIKAETSDEIEEITASSTEAKDSAAEVKE